MLIIDLTKSQYSVPDIATNINIVTISGHDDVIACKMASPADGLGIT